MMGRFLIVGQDKFVLEANLKKLKINYMNFTFCKLLIWGLANKKNLGARAGCLRAFFLFAGLSFMANLQAQGLPSIKKVYTYETFNMHGRPVIYNSYYIIGNSLKNIKGRLYNPFTFFRDSTHVTGYVRYDSIDKEMYIIDNNYDNNGLIITDTANEEHRFLSFFNDTVLNYDGGGDTIISHIKNHDSVIVMQIIEDPAPADAKILKELTFYKGEFYPRSIVIDDPFFPGENKNVVVIGR